MATEDLLLLTTAAHPEIESYWRLRDQKLCNSEVCLCLSQKIVTDLHLFALNIKYFRIVNSYIYLYLMLFLLSNIFSLSN